MISTPIYLQSCTPKIVKISAHLYKILWKKWVALLYLDTLPCCSGDFVLRYSCGYIIQGV